MLKMVYKFLESSNDSIYTSGLDTLESAISMFGEELQPLAKVISGLLTAKFKKQHAKRIAKIKQSLMSLRK